MEEEAGGGGGEELVAKRREEKFRVKERIAQEKVHNYRVALIVS